MEDVALVSGESVIMALARLIEAAHENGVEVHVWTIDDPDDMRRLFALGVDGVITDRADLGLDVLKRLV